MKKVLSVLIFAALLLIGASSAALAAPAGCTCSKSAKPHSESDHKYSYTYSYIVNGNVNAAQHSITCQTCKTNGHTSACALVNRGLEDHDLQISGTGSARKKTCSKCDYSEAAPCEHTNATWSEYVDGCVRECKDCGLKESPISHSYKPYPLTSGSVQHKEEYHGMRCERCGGTGFDKSHTLVNVYRAYAAPKSPITDIANVKSSTLYHAVSSRCTVCGYTFDVTSFSNPQIKHVFKNNACVQCGVKRTILPKVKSLKAAQKGKIKETKRNVPEHWEWVGNKLYYREASVVKSYSFKVNLKWKKVKNAYGYVVSTDKLIEGDYVNTVGTGYSHTVTKKTNYTYFALVGTLKKKKVTIYVAPLSKDGFIGKAQRVTVKIK